MFFLLYGHRTSFYDFLTFLEDLQKSLEVFRSISKLLENFGNGSKVIFRCFYDFQNFRKIFKSARKSLEIFGKLWKCSEIFSDIFTSEDMENILHGTWMYCHMDSISGLFSSKTLLPI